MRLHAKTVIIAAKKRSRLQNETENLSTNRILEAESALEDFTFSFYSKDEDEDASREFHHATAIFKLKSTRLSTEIEKLKKEASLNGEEFYLEEEALLLVEILQQMEAFERKLLLLISSSSSPTSSFKSLEAQWYAEMVTGRLSSVDIISQATDRLLADEDGSYQSNPKTVQRLKTIIAKVNAMLSKASCLSELKVEKAKKGKKVFASSPLYLKAPLIGVVGAVGVSFVISKTFGKLRNHFTDCSANQRLNTESTFFFSNSASLLLIACGVLALAVAVFLIILSFYSLRPSFFIK